MNISKIAIDLSVKCRPILVKIIPIGWLRAVKEHFVEKNTQKLKNVNIKKFDPAVYKDGINIVGNIKADTGIGQSTRLVADIISLGAAVGAAWVCCPCTCCVPVGCVARGL